MSNVPVIQAVRAAEAFRRLHWRRVAGVLGVAALGSTLGTAGALVQNLNIRALGEVIYIVASLMAYAALLRLAFVDEHPGDPEFQPGAMGFQFGRPELRLLGVGALLAFVLLLAALLAFFFVMIVVASSGLGAVTSGATPEQVAAAVGPGGQAAIVLVGLLFVMALAYFSIRISLASPATVANKQVMVFRSWGITHGQFWRILGANALIAVPMFAAGIVVGLLTKMLGGGGAAPVLSLPAALLIGAVQGVTLAFVILPLNAGLGAFLYRGLRPSPDVDVFGDK